jgi:hypothetical protein
MTGRFFRLKDGEGILGDENFENLFRSVQRKAFWDTDAPKGAQVASVSAFSSPFEVGDIQ